MINSLIKEQIKNILDSQADIQIESCGLVLGGLLKTSVVALKNTHPDPANNSRIDHRDLSKFSYDNIKAFWHTHLDSHPNHFTHTDIEMSHQTQKPIILYHPHSDAWDYYEPNNPNPFPLKYTQLNPKQTEFYQNIPFQWGRSDCFSIVRRYCLGVLGVDLGEFTRTNTDNFPSKNYKCPLDVNRELMLMPPGMKIKQHDIFAIALGDGTEPNHAAVLVDAEQNLILHSMSPQSCSKIEPYGRYLRQRTVAHYRLKRLC